MPRYRIIFALAFADDSPPLPHLFFLYITFFSLFYTHALLDIGFYTVVYGIRLCLHLISLFTCFYVSSCCGLILPVGSS